MQILELLLYGRAGQIRRIEFRPGELNIITGESKSGKSAIADIIRYCLGSETLRVPESTVFRKVAWYGLRGTSRFGTFFSGRPVPPEGQQSSSQAMLETPSTQAPTFA